MRAAMESPTADVPLCPARKRSKHAEVRYALDRAADAHRLGRHASLLLGRQDRCELRQHGGRLEHHALSNQPVVQAQASAASVTAAPRHLTAAQLEDGLTLRV